jgi:hypothetical protein
MFKKIAFFALFLAVTGLFAATSVNAQRLIKVTKTDSIDTLVEVPVTEAISYTPLQCANGGVGQSVKSCGTGGTDDNWESGNMNGNKAHYQEGKSIHYRGFFGGLAIGQQYTIVLGYDILKGSPNIHAIDYLKSYDADISAPVYSVVPCGSRANISGHPCETGNDVVNIAILDDPDVPNAGRCYNASGVDQGPTPCTAPNKAGFEPVGGRFIRAWGVEADATMTSIAYGTSEERLVTITFTPTVSNPVFGWSGHIALGSEWQAYNGGTGAGSISGSPYHMYNRGGGVNDFSGAQDLQLATSAIIQPSAADATIAGRVTDSYGRAIASAKLTLTNAMTGQVETAYTNTFGYYKFDAVQVGDFFVMSVQHRRYLFVNGSVSFSLEDNISGLNFQASR